MSRRTATANLTGSLVLVAALLLAACGTSGDQESAPTTSVAATAEGPGEFSGYVRSPAVEVAQVSLPEAGGTEVDMVADEDGLLIVFFGFASCPDICPMTLNILRTAVGNQTPEDQERVQVAMVTIDPTVDTAEAMDRYVAQYFDDGLALRTDDLSRLRAATDAFGADYRIRMNEEGKREVAHSDDLYVVDDTGTVVLIWPFGVSPEAITADLTRLLDGERPEPAG